MVCFITITSIYSSTAKYSPNYSLFTANYSHVNMHTILRYKSIETYTTPPNQKKSKN